MGLVACCLIVLSGCGSGSGSEAEEKQADLEFTEVELACERADGWFGARGARFEITGSVKNNTENPVNRDNLPRIKSGEETFKPSLRRRNFWLVRLVTSRMRERSTLGTESSQSSLSRARLNIRAWMKRKPS